MIRPLWSESRFSGDGRGMISPLSGIDGLSVRISVAQEIIIQFCRRGCAEINNEKPLMWVVLEYCELREIMYYTRNKRIYINKCQEGRGKRKRT